MYIEIDCNLKWSQIHFELPVTAHAVSLFTKPEKSHENILKEKY